MSKVRRNSCLLGFSHFRYHGNWGWSEPNSTCTVTFVDPKNRLLRARIWQVSSVQAEI